MHCSIGVTETRRHKVQIKINDADRPMINVDPHIKLSEITEQLATCRHSTTSSATVCTVRLILLGRVNKGTFDEPQSTIYGINKNRL